jgi:hypothetical protein
MNLNKLVLLGSAMVAVGGCSRPQTTETSPTTTAASSSVPDTGRVRGVVQTVSSTGLTVRTYGGQTVNVPLDAKTGFAWVINSDLSTLKDGDFVGTATTGPDNALHAVELVIFPEAMRGTGEGHYDWDVPGVVAAAGGGGSGSNAMTNGIVQSAMTNGTVQGQSAMTNGTGSAGAGKPGETTLTISYKGGVSKVLVPVGTPIVRFEPTERATLAAGQKVFAVTTPDAPNAKFVAIGKNGLTPPM